MFSSCADDGVAVLFSSHVIAELERICDYLVVLQNGRVQVAGDIDELRAGHRIVNGPPDWPERTGVSVINATRTVGGTSALVRLDAAISIGPGFDQAQPTFDELAMGYLATPHVSREEVTT
jgi:ABC-2 type transport system ATP-binding protein